MTCRFVGLGYHDKAGPRVIIRPVMQAHGTAGGLHACRARSGGRAAAALCSETRRRRRAAAAPGNPDFRGQPAGRACPGRAAARLVRVSRLAHLRKPLTLPWFMER